MNLSKYDTINPVLEFSQNSITDVLDDEDNLTVSFDSLTIENDLVQDILYKSPLERSSRELDILLNFIQDLEAFKPFTAAVKRAFCQVMDFIAIEKAGTIVYDDGEEIEYFSVIINGEVKIDRNDPETNTHITEYQKCGSSLGLSISINIEHFSGVMVTTQDDCHFICLKKTDIHRILNIDVELLGQHTYQENNTVVMVTEAAKTERLGYRIIRGTEQKLLEQLLIETHPMNMDNMNTEAMNMTNISKDKSYVEIFLLTHRAFLSSSKLMEYLLKLMHHKENKNKIVQLVLLWVHNHFVDFETIPIMMEHLEMFERMLEKENITSPLRVLQLTCTEQARTRVITMVRASKYEALQFELMGGYEKGFGIFIDWVEEDSIATRAGLRKGDHVLKINNIDLKYGMLLSTALLILNNTTHIKMTVKYSLLGRARKQIIQRGLLSADLPSRGRQCLLRRSDVSQLDIRQPIRRCKIHQNVCLGNRVNRQSLAENNGDTKNSYGMAFGRQNKFKHKGIHKFLSNLSPNGMIKTLKTSTENRNYAFSGLTGTREEPSEHSLKILQEDGSSKYILINRNTKAKSVVIQALKLFDIKSKLHDNYALVEMFAEYDVVKSRRLPDIATNLADQMKHYSRYYVMNIKGINDSHQIPKFIDNIAIKEMKKESVVMFLNLDVAELAAQLMARSYSLFTKIEPTEYIDDAFDLKSALGTPNLLKFKNLSNKEMFWVVTVIVTESSKICRLKKVKKFIEIALHCYKRTRNFNTMFSIISGIEHRAVKRLKETWMAVPPKYMKWKDSMLRILDPSMNFRKYRNIIENAIPPKIPIFPVACKDLTFIELGNPSRIDNLVNFEKMTMLAKKVNEISKMCSATHNLNVNFNTGSLLGKAKASEVIMNHSIFTNYSQKDSMFKHHSMRNKSIVPDPVKLYAEEQRARKVRAYLTKADSMVIQDEELLLALSEKCEPQIARNSVAAKHSDATTNFRAWTKPVIAPSQVSSYTNSNSYTIDSPIEEKKPNSIDSTNIIVHGIAKQDVWLSKFQRRDFG